MLIGMATLYDEERYAYLVLKHVDADGIGMVARAEGTHDAERKISGIIAPPTASFESFALPFLYQKSILSLHSQ